MKGAREPERIFLICVCVHACVGLYYYTFRTLFPIITYVHIVDVFVHDIKFMDIRIHSKHPCLVSFFRIFCQF